MPPKTKSVLNTTIVDKANAIKELLAKKSAKDKADSSKKNAVFYTTVLRKHPDFQRVNCTVMLRTPIDDYVFVKDLSEKIKLTNRMSLEDYVDSKGEPWKQFDKYKQPVPVVIGIDYLSKETLQLIIKMNLTSGGMYEKHVLPMYEATDNKTLWMYAVPVDPDELSPEDHELMKTHMKIATDYLAKFKLCHKQVEMSIFVQQEKKHFLLGRLHQLVLQE